jgi:HlyD family secretion protein
MKTTLSIIVIAVILTAGGAWYWNTTTGGTPQFRKLPAENGDLLISVSAAGTVQPVEVVDVGAQIPGRILSFGPDRDEEGETVDYGSRVKEGDILAKLDDEPYLAELDSTEAALLLAQANVDQAEAQLHQAKQAYDRAEKLRGTNSESDYERAEAAYRIANAEVAVAKARLKQAEIAKQAVQIKLKYTVIKSPIDGVVIDRRADVGQTVVAALNAPSLFLLARDLSKMQVLAAVNEADIGDIHVGQRVMFKVDAYRDRVFHGEVSQIRLNAGMSHNVVTYDVVVDIDNTEGKLLPYMTANLQFVVAERSNVLLVPNQALRWRPTKEQITSSSRDKYKVGPDGRDSGKVDVETPTVWVEAADGLVRPIEIQAGMSDGMMTEVEGGNLKPDTKVAVSVRRESQKDFVNSFVSRVTRKKDQEED